MASGGDLPIIYEALHGNNGGAAVTSILVNAAAPNARQKLVGIWLWATGAPRTFSAPPAGWTKIYDQTFTPPVASSQFRFGLFYNPTANPASTTDHTFGMSGASPYSANGNDWEGLHGDPDQLIANTPVTVTAGQVSSFIVPTMTVGPGLMPVYFWAAKYNTVTQAQNAVWTLPADLELTGNVSGSSSAIRASCGVWRTAGASQTGARGLQHAAGTVAAKTITTQNTGMAAGCVGIAMALRCSDQGGMMAMAS